MQRIVNLVRRPQQVVWLCRRYVTEAEIEEKYYQKGPLDPAAVDLIKKFESDIVYSSYVENNKKPMRYSHRQIVKNIVEHHKKRVLYEQAMQKPFSLALKYSSNVLTDVTPQVPAKPVVTATDTLPHAMEKLDAERDSSRTIIMNESKLEIFRQMRQREAELEETTQKYPDKWMQDYETYDENENDDLTADSEYGTQGVCASNSFERI